MSQQSMSLYFNPAQATATRERHSREVVVRKIVATESIHLSVNITPLQAAGLLRLCEHVGGLPSGTRGVFDAIRNALLQRGVEPAAREVVSLERDVITGRADPGVVRFNDRQVETANAEGAT